MVGVLFDRCVEIQELIISITTFTSVFVAKDTLNGIVRQHPFPTFQPFS